MTATPPADLVPPRRPLIPVNGRGAALAVALGGMAVLAAMDAVAKGLGQSLPTVQIVLFRFAVTAVVMACFIAVTRRDWPRWRYSPRHALRGAVMGLTALLFFYGITYLPLVVGTALAMSAPIFIAAMGVLVLKERLSPRLIAAIAVSLLGGVVIVSGGGGGSTTGSPTLLAWAAAILAPVSYAVGVILLKVHSTHEGASAMTMAQSLAAAMIALPFALPGFVMPTADMAVPVLALGVLGAFGYLLMVSALRVLPASVFSLVDSSTLLWAAVLGLVFFSEVPSPAVIVGGLLIMGACLWGARPRPTAPVETP